LLYLLEQEVIWGCNSSRALLSLYLFPIDKSEFRAKIWGSYNFFCLANIENFKFFSNVYDNWSQDKKDILDSKFISLRVPANHRLARVCTYNSIDDAEGKKIE
jgi:hypothetical protein